MTAIRTTVREGRRAQAVRALSRGRLRRAVNNAINWTAYDTRNRLRKYLDKKIDEPTRRTVNSVRVIRSKQSTLAARLRIIDDAPKGTAPAKYLANLQYGGARGPKRSEKALRRAGHILPDQYIVPGPHARLNRFGNVSAGTYTKMLSGLGASSDPLQNSASSNGWFVMRKRSKRIAIAQRLKTKTKIMFWIVDGPPRYSRQIRFARVGRRVARKLFPRRFRRALKREIPRR